MKTLLAGGAPHLHDAHAFQARHPPRLALIPPAVIEPDGYLLMNKCLSMRSAASANSTFMQNE